MTDNSAVETAVKSASYNIVLQVFLRIFSSLSNAVILRFITKESLGVINVRLMLLYSTCHCFSREAFRRSGVSSFDHKCPQKKFNLLWLTFPACIICSYVLRYVWLYWLEVPDPRLVPDYSYGVNTVLISVLIENVAEPAYIFGQSFQFVKLKIFIEGISLTVKSVSMVVFLSKWQHHSMYAFCYSQALGSVVYTFTYYVYFWWFLKTQQIKKCNTVPIKSIFGMLPDLSKIVVFQYVNLDDLRLTWSFFKQTLLKQLLTEGERYLMTVFNILSFAEQGVYDVVNNLGSLAARFVFLPIEESGYILFTQMLARDKPACSQKNVHISLTVLENLLKLMVLLGLMILTFGYSYSRLLLLLYGGSTLSSSITVTLLRWHCVYILFLAVNGVTECFKFAVMSHNQIDRYNKNLVFLSAGFLLASYCLVKLLGAVGFIIANCINMGFRIFHSMSFLRKYFGMSQLQLLQKIVPRFSILMVLVLTFCLTSLSEVYLCCTDGFRLWIWHVIIGICCMSLFLFAVSLKERELLKFVYSQWKKKSSGDIKKSE